MSMNSKNIDTVLFDLDNVLVDMSNVHYRSLNMALKKYGYNPIDYQEHLDKFNGLPTKVKLMKLSDQCKVSHNHHQGIWKAKQDYTIKAIESTLKYDKDKVETLAALISDGYTLGCVTNSIRKTAKAMLKQTGMYYFMSLLVSNEDVKNPKPNPEPYISAMKTLRSGTKQTLIVEDSNVGLKSAMASKAHVMPVKSWKYVTHDNIYKFLRKFDND